MQELLVSFIQKGSIKILKRIIIHQPEAISTPILPNKIKSQGDGNDKGDSKADQHREKTGWIRWCFVVEEKMWTDDITSTVSDEYLFESR